MNVSAFLYISCFQIFIVLDILFLHIRLTFVYRLFLEKNVVAFFFPFRIFTVTLSSYTETDSFFLSKQRGFRRYRCQCIIKLKLVQLGKANCYLGKSNIFTFYKRKYE